MYFCGNCGKVFKTGKFWEGDSDIYEEVNSETLLEHTKNLIIIREKADSMKDSIQVIKKELQLSQFNIIKVLHEEAAKNLTWSDDMEKALN